MFRFETWVTYVSHTRFCFRWKKQQNNYVIQNHIPDSPKRNALCFRLFVSFFAKMRPSKVQNEWILFSRFWALSSLTIDWRVFVRSSVFYHRQDLYRTWLWIIGRISYKKQELLFCVVFVLFVFVLCVVPNVACVPALFILDCHSVLSNVCLMHVCASRAYM